MVKLKARAAETRLVAGRPRLSREDPADGDQPVRDGARPGPYPKQAERLARALALKPHELLEWVELDATRRPTRTTR